MAPAPAGFSRFPDLPPELQLKVWELASLPARLLYLAPDIKHPSEVESKAAEWNFRWTVHPKSAAVPGLLHACHDSRSIWRPHYAWVDDTVYPGRGRRPNPCHVRFGSHLVNYAVDVIVAFPHMRMHPSSPVSIPPFAGLDRRQIRHVAWYEPVLRSEISLRTFHTTQLESMAQLQSLTMLVTDFVLDVEEEVGAGCDLSSVKLESEDAMRLAFADLHLKDFFILSFAVPESGGPQSASLALPRAPPLSLNANLVRAWLWHLGGAGRNWSIHGGETWWNHVKSLNEQVGCKEFDFMPCPLCPLAANHRYHTVGMIKEYEPPFELKWAVLCPREWERQDGFNEEAFA